jgi:type III secretion protein L
MHFLKLKTTELAPDQRVVKAAEFATFLEGEAVLAQAAKERDAILAEAREDAAAEKRRGYAEGLMEGKMQIAEQMVGTVERSVRYLGEIEASMVEIVLTAVRNIIGDIDDKDRIKSVVRKVLGAARDQKRVLLRVSRADEDNLKAELDRILRDFPGITYIDIEPDSRLQQGDCILETEIGVVEATLESQIESVRSALAKTLAGSTEL